VLQSVTRESSFRGDARRREGRAGQRHGVARKLLHDLGWLRLTELACRGRFVPHLVGSATRPREPTRIRCGT
jgi:hypothetical protein